MFTKTFLLVLFGAALVSANPISENEEKSVSTELALPGFFELDPFAYLVKSVKSSRSFKEKWEQLKKKWLNWLESVKPEWENFKEFGKTKYESIKAKFVVIKEKGEELLEKIKETYEVITTNGKDIYNEFKEYLDVLKEKWQKAKKVGSEAYSDVTDLLDELNNDLGDIKGKLKLALVASKMSKVAG